MTRRSLSDQNHSPTVAQPTSDPTELPHQSHWLSQFWDALMFELLRLSEPTVVQKCNRSGQPYYDIYDPATGRAASCLSEDEARIWLDKLHY